MYSLSMDKYRAKDRGAVLWCVVGGCRERLLRLLSLEFRLWTVEDWEDVKCGFELRGMCNPIMQTRNSKGKSNWPA